MNELTVFKHSNFGEVRTVVRDGCPWFVAADVCKTLDIGNDRQALARLDDDEKGVISTDISQGRSESLNAVNEPGLYALVLGSRKPEAKAFKRWVTHEVLPAIRKHGVYATPQTIETMLADPDSMIRALTALKAERELRRALADENETLEIALNESLKFYTVAKYNKTFSKGWSMSQCQFIGRRMSAYCRARAIEVRACETNDERFGAENSYPLTAWEGFLDEAEHRALIGDATLREQGRGGRGRGKNQGRYY
jgi:prophage antirepressor-like protein